MGYNGDGDEGWKESELELGFIVSRQCQGDGKESW